MSDQEDDEVKARMTIAGGDIALAKWGELAIHQTGVTIILSAKETEVLRQLLWWRGGND